MLSDLVNFLRHPFSPDAREECRLPPSKLEWLELLRAAIRNAGAGEWESFGHRWDTHAELGYRLRVGELVFELGSVQGWGDRTEPYAQYFWRVRGAEAADSYLASVRGSVIAQSLFESVCVAKGAFPSPPGRSEDSG